MLKLVKLSKDYRRQLDEMMTEWVAAGEKIVPWAIAKNDFRDFENYLSQLEIGTEEAAARGLVPDTTLFALDTERDIFVGAVNIRHFLNEKLLFNGGHIGDGVRPSERRKGFATKMVGLALDECRKLGITRVLMCCDKDNIGSAHSIIRNGGKLENEVVEEDGTICQRYWIEL